MPAVSVIIPVYLSETTIERCVSSVQAQTLGDIEIIAVVDGVVDKSKDILDRLAAEDSRLRVVVQENAGVSTARNHGMQLAQGEFIAFVDSDDTIDEDYLATLYEQREFDLVVCGHKYIVGGETTDKKPEDKQLNLRSSSQMISLVENPLIKEICGKLYSTDIIKRNFLHFDTTMRLAEDTCFALRYITRCRTARLISYSGYNYYATHVTRKYRMSAKEAAHHIRIVLTLLGGFEHRHAIDLHHLRMSYVMLFTGTFLHYVAHMRSHGDFVHEVHRYTYRIPEAFAYKPRIFFRYIESELILHFPSIGYYIRRTFV